MSVNLTLLRKLRRDKRGATILEYAFVLPVFSVMMMGAFDIGHSLYARSVLEAELQQAGRDSTLGSNSGVAQQAALDSQINNVVRTIVGQSATITPTRTAFASYARMNQRAEVYTDTNSNGVCDNNEVFEDANRNGVWNADSGRNGQGGAKDAVLYEVTVSYPRMFPIAGALGWSTNTVFKAKTVLRNQPYDNQTEPLPGNCP